MRTFSRLVACLGVIPGGLWANIAPAHALLPAHPPLCSWTFGSLTTLGAAGTQVLQVNLVPASPTMSCIQTVSLTSRITDSANAVPPGIVSDGGTGTVTLLFSGGEDPAPSVTVAWHGYCTVSAEPVFLHLSGGGTSAVYPLGNSRPCSQGPGPNSSVDPPRVFSPDPAVGLAPVPGGGYRIALASGVVLHQPGTVTEGGGVTSSAPFVNIASAPAGGFWLVASNGGVFAFGGAGFYGSAVGIPLAAPIVDIASTPSGHGYWLVAGDGGVFAFGDAKFLGSAGGIKLAAPVVGMAPTADGGGYWLVAADGGVFAYGDAHFYGSAAAVHLVAAVVGVAADALTGGYWLVAGDGGVFTYNAPFYGAAGGLHLDAPVTSLAPTPGYGGYWLLGSDGGIFAYGNAPYLGNGASLVKG
jgi:hypothetical protein